MLGLTPGEQHVWRCYRMTRCPRLMMQQSTTWVPDNMVVVAEVVVAPHAAVHMVVVAFHTMVVPWDNLDTQTLVVALDILDTQLVVALDILDTQALVVDLDTLDTQTLVVDMLDTQTLVVDLDILDTLAVVVVDVPGGVALPQDRSSVTAAAKLGISQPNAVELWQVWWKLATMKKRRRSLPHICLKPSLTVWKPGVRVKRWIKNLLPAIPFSPHFVLAQKGLLWSVIQQLRIMCFLSRPTRRFGLRAKGLYCMARM